MPSTDRSAPRPGDEPADRRRLWLVLAAIVGVVVLAIVAAWALGGGDDEDEPEEAAETTTTTEAPAIAPLTGEVVDDRSLIERPALVVKIDNVDRASRPQAGLNRADLVVEEKVEGSISRFAAVFHSRDVSDLGPIRSARSTDIAIMATLGRPLFAYSGANPTFLDLVRSAPLVDVGVDVAPDAYRRESSRQAPDNLFADGGALRDGAPEGGEAPPTQFTYREGDAAPSVSRAVEGVDLDFGPDGAAISYRWDAGRSGWARTQNGTPHVDVDGEQIVPTNVIVQFVAYDDTGITDVSGAPVPEARLVGDGDAWVLVDGQVVEGRWSRPSDGEPTRFETAEGATIGLLPGTTWIALVPVDRPATLVAATP
jgi:hypothetical protein